MLSLDDLEGNPAYRVGSWRSPYVKVYSIGGKNRVAEISNYPRVYKDMTPHVYTKDTPFIVSQDDLNYRVDDKLYYIDEKDNLFSVGEQAVHWKNTLLPGAFPLWIESEELPFSPNLDKYIFPIKDVPSPIVDLTEGSIKIGSIFTKFTEQALNNIKVNLHTDKIVLDRKTEDSDKQIIRIKYRRVF